MRESRVLIVTKAEVHERLVGHFGDMFAQDYNQLGRFMRGEVSLPNFKEMTVGDLANLAQECDLFRGEQRVREDCRMVLMEEGGQFYRISAPEQDKPEVEEAADTE